MLMLKHDIHVGNTEGVFLFLHPHPPRNADFHMSDWTAEAVDLSGTFSVNNQQDDYVSRHVANIKAVWIGMFLN